MKLPKELLVYVYDYEEKSGGRKGVPLFAVARNAEEIPEDCDGQIVGKYVLNGTRTFRVRRELK